jgi:cobalt-zinc-cadmium efflux system membrane fusion protein
MDRSADVHCHFEDYNKTLLPGMYMNADVEVKANTAATINDEAIVSYEGKDFVFVSREQNKFELLEIKKGSSENNYTEIATLDGSTISNFKIVTHGAYSLLMQLKNKSDD